MVVVSFYELTFCENYQKSEIVGFSAGALGTKLKRSPDSVNQLVEP